MTKPDKIKPDWLLRNTIGNLLCIILTYGIVSVFAWYGPGGIDAPVKVQFNMWIISLIWLSIYSFIFLFKTGLRAVMFLIGANIITYGIYFLLGALS